MTVCLCLFDIAHHFSKTQQPTLRGIEQPAQTRQRRMRGHRSHALGVTRESSSARPRRLSRSTMRTHERKACCCCYAPNEGGNLSPHSGTQTSPGLVRRALSALHHHTSSATACTPHSGNVGMETFFVSLRTACGAHLPSCSRRR